MSLNNLREEVLQANLELVRRGLVLYTFGNASGISREQGLVVIKPSGVPYETMKPEDLVVVDLQGNIVEGTLRPSSDLPTHLVLYKAFPSIAGVAHTHSRAATSWAQARRAIPCFGTTHADYFQGPIPVTKPMKPAEIRKDYELNTGLAIVRCIGKRDPLHTPGVLVAGHAPFCWGAIPGRSGAQRRHRGGDCRAGVADARRKPPTPGQLRSCSTKNISSASMEIRHTTDRSPLTKSLV